MKKKKPEHKKNLNLPPLCCTPCRKRPSGEWSGAQVRTPMNHSEKIDSHFTFEFTHTFHLRKTIFWVAKERDLEISRPLRCSMVLLLIFGAAYPNSKSRKK